MRTIAGTARSMGIDVVELTPAPLFDKGFLTWPTDWKEVPRGRREGGPHQALHGRRGRCLLVKQTGERNERKS